MIEHVNAGQPMSSAKMNEVIDKVNELDDKLSDRLPYPVVIHTLPQIDTRLSWREVVGVSLFSIIAVLIVVLLTVRY